MKRALARSLVSFLCLACLPAAAYAQASFRGIVRDTSGAVLPGVNVEASSPVPDREEPLLGNRRNGRYIIQDLRPGTYRVAFTLPGFKTVVRDAVELLGTSVVTVNADMTVGTLEETITVTGATPTVDLQSTTRQVVINQEIVSDLPSSRTPFALGVLIAGVSQSFGGRDVGGAVVAEVAALAANGGRTGDQRMMVNGVALSSGIAGGWGGGAVPNATGTAEYAIDVSGVDAQAATGGVRVNFIPRDGGNRFSGTFSGSFARESFASDNYTGTDVEKRGLAAPSTIKGNGEINPGVGGPLVRDRLWFFVSGSTSMPTTWSPACSSTRTPTSRTSSRYVRSSAAGDRPPGQATVSGPVHVSAEPEEQVRNDLRPGGLLRLPVRRERDHDAGRRERSPVPAQRFVTADWTMPLTNRVLIEASGIHRVERWGGMHLQTGKGENIDAIVAGHNVGHRQSESSDWRQSDLSVRRPVQQLVELEHPLPRGAELRDGLALVQGRLQQRVPPS